MWLEAVRALPDEAVVVVHNPPTPRYGRAQSKLGYLLRTSLVLGEKRHGRSDRAVEVAAWAPPPTGRGSGYYWCVRLHLDEHERAEVAVLYCFYDGTENSPGLRSLGEARAYCIDHGFERVSDEDD